MPVTASVKKTWAASVLFGVRVVQELVEERPVLGICWGLAPSPGRPHVVWALEMPGLPLVFYDDGWPGRQHWHGTLPLAVEVSTKERAEGGVLEPIEEPRVAKLQLVHQGLVVVAHADLLPLTQLLLIKVCVCSGKT